MNSLDWMKNLTSDFIGYDWGKSPFQFDGKAIVTDGHSLVAVTVNGDCLFPVSEEGGKACAKFLGLEVEQEKYTLESLQAWMGQCDLENPEYSLVFGCFVDRTLMFEFIRHLDGGYFQFGKKDNGEGDMLVFKGDGWTCVVMGLKKIAMVPGKEYPTFPRGFKCPTS